MNRALPILKDAWRLANPYFRSEEKWSAWVLLIAIIVLNLLMVALDVVFNFWNRAFFNALQGKDYNDFLTLLLTYRSGTRGFMPGFVAIAFTYIVIGVYAIYLNQWLQIRWRNWMTGRFLDEWLADRAYYRISLTGSPAGTGTDNPDQRIAEDLRDFTGTTLTLGIEFMSNIVELVSFIGILWGLSGALMLFGVNVPGYMVWVALLYAIAGTWVTHLVGRPLALLRFLQQRFEADFRFSLVRFRENVEGVALYGGEREEKTGMAKRFETVVRNWRDLMNRLKLLNALVYGYRQLTVIFPYVVAAPRYFFGPMPLGGLTQTAHAFGQVQSAMSWFVNNYAALAAWSATVERLATFERAIADARAASGSGVRAGTAAGKALELRDLNLELPSGTPLVAHQSLQLLPGVSTMIGGRSGSGKSTLFRAIAGIWPYGSGTVERPPGSYLFLPQRPYIPLGTLRHAVAYPGRDQDYSDAAVRQALRDVGLAQLLDRLDEEDNWTQRLSGGEQQRLAMARALLAKPDWLFLDEATASLDPQAETDLFQVLKDRLPGTTFISVSHQPGVARFHQRRLVLQKGPGESGRLVEAERVE